MAFAESVTCLYLISESFFKKNKLLCIILEISLVINFILFQDESEKTAYDSSSPSKEV